MDKSFVVEGKQTYSQLSGRKYGGACSKYLAVHVINNAHLLISGHG